MAREQQRLRVLVGCEFSGIVRDAFRARGYDAVSCDLLPSERPGPHIVGDIFDLLDRDEYWDLMVFFWPCTNLAVSGARWFNEKHEEQRRDVEAFTYLATFPLIPCIAGENPIGVLSSQFRKPDQIIQPWMFGHPETKATCLWLKNLPPLKPTRDVRAEMATLPDAKRHRVHNASPGPDRWKNRSRTLPLIAEAMADQWGALLPDAVEIQ